MSRHELWERVQRLRFKSEMVKEASFEMSHGINVILGEGRNYYLISQKAEEGAGKRERSADIKDNIKREQRERG